jgi:hypothetical protein
MLMAQTDTSSKKTKIKIRPLFMTIENYESLKTDFHTFDTSLNGFHQLNPYRKHDLPYQDLGLPGTPIQPLFLNTVKTPGFDLGFNRMNDWLYNINGKSEKIIIAPTPYTMLNYSQGAKDLIFLELLHTQNITRRWNVGIEYRRLKTNNYLFYQMGGDIYTKIRIPSIYNVKLFSSFRSKMDKYHLIGSLNLNKVNLRESGGLSKPETFDSTSGNLRVFENPLNNVVSTIKQPALVLKQYYRFGKTSFQTMLKDSILDTVSFEFKPRGYFYHQLLMNRTIFQYTDPEADTPYYPFPIFGNETNDSMSLKQISNSAGIALKNGNSKFNQYIKMGVEHNLIWVYNSHNSQKNFHNLSVNGEIAADLKSKYGKIEIFGLGQFFISGYNSKDYLLQGRVRLTVSDKVRLNGNISSQRHVVDYFQNRANNNFVLWDQELKPVYRNGLEANIEFLPLKLKAGFNASNFQNYVLYFNEKAPAGVDFSYLEIFLSNDIRFRKWSWHNRLSSQKSSAVYHLPELALSGGIFWENRFFKKNMLARFGVDYYWFSSYFADAYNPYLRQFVWQDKTKIGNYPYFDIYVSAQIQTMNLFIRFEHLNQGLSGNRYYSTPLYPNPPRFFRFGVNWRLFH